MTPTPPTPGLTPAAPGTIARHEGTGKLPAGTPLNGHDYGPNLPAQAHPRDPSPQVTHPRDPSPQVAHPKAAGLDVPAQAHPRAAGRWCLRVSRGGKVCATEHGGDVCSQAKAVGGQRSVRRLAVVGS